MFTSRDFNLAITFVGLSSQAASVLQDSWKEPAIRNESERQVQVLLKEMHQLYDNLQDRDSEYAHLMQSQLNALTRHLKRRKDSSILLA